MNATETAARTFAAATVTTYSNRLLLDSVNVEDGHEGVCHDIYMAEIERRGGFKFLNANRYADLNI